MDTTPPEITRTVPLPDSTLVADLPFIELHFSEPMNRSSVEKSLRSNLYSRKKLELKWKGSKTLRIFLPDSLRKNTTYVFTIGTEAKDQHGVNMRIPFNLAFSTGRDLHRCKVKGKILNKTGNASVTIGLIEAEFSSPDTLWYQRPFINIGTSNDDGTFELKYIKPGRYRLLAFIDENYNEKFDLFEKFGLFPADISFIANGDSILHMNTYLQKVDTSAFRIKEVKIDKEQSRISIVANKPVVFDRLQVFLRDSLLRSLYNYAGADSTQLLVYLDNPLIKDSLKIQLLSKDSILYETSMHANFELDSLPAPKFSFTPPTVIYFEDTLQLTFSTPVDPEALKYSLSLMLKNQEQPYQIDWKDFKQIGILPRTGIWKIGQTYRMVFNTGTYHDFWGQSLKDSVYTYDLKIISDEELGGISGRLGFSYEYPQFTFLFNNIKTGKIIKRFWPVKGGLTFEFNDLPEGHYTISGFFDNGDRKWFGGQLIPFKPCEPVLFSNDTIRVRARWTKQGILISE